MTDILRRPLSLLIGLNRDEPQELTDNDRMMSALSRASYYKNKATRRNIGSQYGYDIDDELSDDKTAVYRRGDDAIVAYRGSWDIDDLGESARLAVTGKVSDNRMNSTISIAQRARQKYRNVRATGHSLGGTLGNEVSQRLNMDATTFNPGAHPITMRKAPRNRVIRNKNDLVSLAFANQAVHVKSRPYTIMDHVGGRLYSQFRDHHVDQFVFPE
jgi:hypothetical protein